MFQHPSAPRSQEAWLVLLTKCRKTGSGRSYQRSSIIAAINAKAVDPVTRETLTKDELRPNLALKQACEWYLSNNGWAYDW
jgi:STIP1 homology and U-box containing protein 1